MIKKLLFSFALTTLCWLALPSSASAQYASTISPSTGTRHPISNANEVGSFYSPTSISYLYVPSSHTYARINLIEEVANHTSGGVNRLNLCYPNGTGCATLNDPNAGSYVQRANNSTDTEVINGTTYRKYGVTVTTFAITETFFRLSTNGGARIGTFAGATSGSLAGTTYANSLSGYNNNTLWNQHLAFSPNCGVNNTNPWIELYDLDMYNAPTFENGPEQNPNLRIRLLRVPKPGVSGSPTYLALTGNVNANPSSGTYKPVTNAALGDAATYYPSQPGWGADYSRGPNNVLDSTEDHNGANTYQRPLWRVRINGTMRYNDDYRYVLEINGIRPRNLIRVRLPYDQMNASKTCPPADVCNNIPGNQPATPSGFVRVGNNCYRNDRNPSLSSQTVCGTPPSYTVQLRITSEDLDGNNYNIQYRWPGSTTWTNVGRHTNGYFYINTGTRGRVGSATVYLRTNGRYPGYVNPTTQGNPDAARTVNFGPCYRDVQGRVYNAYNKNQRYAGLTINTCVTGVSATTNSTGWFSFRVLNNRGYCVRMGSLPTGANSRRVRPYSEGYVGCAGFSMTARSPDYCSAYSSYEWQFAGSNNTTGNYATYDRTSDTGFDFAVRFAPTASCAYTGGSPVIEVGTPFTPTMTVRNTGASTRPPASGTVTYTINGNSQNRNYGPLASNTSTNITFSPVTINTAGQYPHTVTVTVRGDGINGASPTCTGINPSDPPTVGLYPYFKEYGGDVWSGGNITDGTDCSAPSDSPGNIYGFNRGSAGGFSGASANLTVTALMNINGYASASHRGSFTNTLPPKGLTFANTGASTYGGNYGASAARCITDYFTQTRDTSITRAGSFPPSTPTPPWSSGNQVVRADGSVRHVNVPSAGLYTIRARGTFHVHNATHFPESIVDAACWNRDLTTDGVVGPLSPISPPTFGLRANGSALSMSPENGGGNCTTDHEYIGTVNVPSTGLNLSILDTLYSDNSGQLIVELSRAGAPSGWPSGRSQYEVSGDLTLTNTTIPTGSQVAVYVDGDVYIRNNIVYQNGASTLAQIPNFALIVRGNIYIAAGVTRIDGLYVAQPDGSANSGVIYTCATAMGNQCRASNVYAQGDNQLSVNGSLVAQRIKWLRVRGTLRNSTPTEAPNFSTGSGTNAAEVILYTPQIWLAPSPLNIPGSSGEIDRYDSIRSLPPIL